MLKIFTPLSRKCEHSSHLPIVQSSYNLIIVMPILEVEAILQVEEPKSFCACDP